MNLALHGIVTDLKKSFVDGAENTKVAKSLIYYTRKQQGVFAFLSYICQYAMYGYILLVCVCSCIAIYACTLADEQIQENAYIIVQQLIHHTDCMGPALAGDALGLSVIYRDTLQRAESLAEERASFGRFLSMESVASKQEASTEVCGDSSVLSFYTTLMRLLAYCASVPCDRTTACLDEAGSNSASRHKQSAICRTRSILQNLIKAEEIVTILSFKSCTGKERGLSAYHKEAALLFLDRVYGMPCLDLLLQLLNNSFIPDVKLALQLSQEVRVCAVLYEGECSLCLELIV